MSLNFEFLKRYIELIDDFLGVCTVCARVCHKDHDLSYSKCGSFFCDCGARGPGICQALTKRSIEKPHDSKQRSIDWPAKGSSSGQKSDLIEIEAKKNRVRELALPQKEKYAKNVTNSKDKLLTELVRGMNFCTVYYHFSINCYRNVVSNQKID